MKKIKGIVLAFFAVVAMVSLTSCGEKGVEGKWKVDEASVSKLMGKDAKGSKVDATADVTADKINLSVDMDMDQDGMKMAMTIEAKCSYTKTETEVTITPEDVKLVKLDLPEELKAIAKAAGMNEDQMKEEFGKEFTSKKEAVTLTYKLEGDKLTLTEKGKNEELILNRQ